MRDLADGMICNGKREFFIQSPGSPIQNFSRCRSWKGVVLEKTVPWFPPWDLGAWVCPLLTDRLMKRNRFVFFAVIWNSAAIFLTPPRSTGPTPMKNY